MWPSAGVLEGVEVFENIGWGEILVLVIVGLFILGPERLPGAAAQLGKAVRQIKEYATGARDQLRSELGPEYDELRKPLEELRSIRDFNPRTAVSRHLWDGENPFDTTPRRDGVAESNGFKPPAAPPRPLEPGERPPYDSDAT